MNNKNKDSKHWDSKRWIRNGFRDFTNKPVFHVSSGTHITFGTVTAQSFRNKWLWLRVDWEDNLSELPPWHKAANVGIFDKKDMIRRIRKL